MIVDCHTQLWSAEAHALYAGGDSPLFADDTHSPAAAGPVDKTIVLGLKSSYLRAGVPNQAVAAYVRRDPARMIGFAAVDPTDRNCLDELKIAHEELRLRGVVVSPGLQDFHPTDTRAMRLYDACVRRGLPIIFEQNHRNPNAKLEYSQPMLLDEVAREFPQLRVVIARLGYPWTQQAIVMLAKHPGVFANVAGLLPHAWLGYSSLLAAHEYGVMHKLLFGSDYPFRSPAQCIEALYSVNQFSHGSTLPPIPRELLRGIVERDTLALLGIGNGAPAPVAVASKIFSDED